MLANKLHLAWCTTLTLGQSCGPRVSARLMRDIPCDMSVQSYCTQPGSAYPWSSVRRYIFENQGSIRRMYGEQRHAQLVQYEVNERKARYHMDEDSIPTLFKFENIEKFLFAQDLATAKLTANQTGGNLTTTTTTTSKPTENKTKEMDNTTPLPSSVDTTTTTTTTVYEELSSTAPIFYQADDLQYETTTVQAEVDDNVVPEETPVDTKPVKGYNACPITQEVVAPYWANNTRGETLALLNVHPFEQYVHWEKCSFENEQMFCRDGCKCEQQYRLHRLLAFDPKNECRGIFADWFRFPGCCVCICYDNLVERINSRRARF